MVQVFLALTRRQETFLLTKEWMSIPWKTQPKTWRDRLYDLAMRFSEIVASSSDNDQASGPREAMNTRIDKTLQIEVELSVWQSSWLKEAYPHQRVGCDCQPPAPFSCICSVPASKLPSTDFALLQVECWSLQLLISTTLSKSLGPEPMASWIAHLHVRSSRIARFMEAASTFPAFKHTAERSSGVTEGFCRTILPTWTLREYRGMRTAS